jgi:hypothetical protein
MSTSSIASSEYDAEDSPIEETPVEETSEPLPEEDDTFKPVDSCFAWITVAGAFLVHYVALGGVYSFGELERSADLTARAVFEPNIKRFQRFARKRCPDRLPRTRYA